MRIYYYYLKKTADGLGTNATDILLTFGASDFPRSSSVKLLINLHHKQLKPLFNTFFHDSESEASKRGSSAPCATALWFGKSADRTIKTPSLNVSCLPWGELCSLIIENVAARWRHRGSGGGYFGVLPKPQASTGLRFYVWSSRSDILRNADALSLSWRQKSPSSDSGTVISDLSAIMFTWQRYGDNLEFGGKMRLQIFAQSWPLCLMTRRSWGEKRKSTGCTLHFYACNSSQVEKCL